jgi:tetratricopeptide (TPR) repeat protein
MMKMPRILPVLLVTAALVPLAGASKPDKLGAAYGAFLAGQWAAQNLDAPRATFYYERAMAADPQAPELAERVLAETLTAGDMKRAVAMAKALAASPKVGRLARFVLAVDMLARGDNVKARAALHDVSGDGGAGASAPLLEAWALAGQGKLDEGVRTLALAGPAAQPLTLAARAMMFEQFNRLPEAEAAYVELAKTGRMPSPMIARYGQLLHRMGRVDDARLIYTALLGNSPNDPLITAALEQLDGKSPVQDRVTARVGAATALAMAAGMRGPSDSDPGVSVILLRLALHLDPQADEARLMLARMLMRSGATAAARSVYAAVDPQSIYGAEATSGLAYAMRTMGEGPAATALVEKAMATTKNGLQKRTLLDTASEFYQMDSRYADAAQALTALLAFEPDDVALRLRRGMMFERLGQWAEARADLEWAVERLPDNAVALNYLGYSLIDRGEDEARAFDLITRAASLRPEDGSIRDSLGWALFLKGDISGALIEVERAAELEPGDATVNHHLGDIYAKLGRTAEARWQWQRALSLKPDEKERAALETKLGAAAAQAPAP